MYSNFAYIYDKLMYDVDYLQWADYLETIFRKYKLAPSLLLDLGCGTGSLTVEMAKRGYEMIGVDLSADMLACAREKSQREGVEILYLNQDMTDFELYGTVDAVVCLMDSINYITEKNHMKRMLKWVRNYLNPGGLFIFDINSYYKFEHVLAKQVYYDVGDDITYIWQNNFDKRRSVCEFDLTFFVREGEQYHKYDEVHHERAYKNDEIAEMLQNAGLEVQGVYDAFSLKAPSEKSERIFFVSKKC